MNLKHLRYFVAVADQGSLAAAARQLSISASPLSRRMRELEIDVGATLFRRNASGVELTDEGTRLLGIARRVVGLTNEISQIASQTIPVGTRLSIGLRSIHPRLRKALLQAIRSARPGVSLTIRPMVPLDQIPALIAGTLDISTIRSQPSEEEISCMPLFFEELGLAVPDRPPFSEKLEIELSDLQGMKLLSPLAPVHQFIEGILQAASKTVRIDPNVYGGAAALISLGDHYMIVPMDKDAPSRRAVDEPGVLIRRVATGPHTLTTYLAWRTDRGESDLSDLINSLRVHFVRPESV